MKRIDLVNLSLISNNNKISNKKLNTTDDYYTKKVYAILTWHNFDEPMESIIFVSEDKSHTINVLNYLERYAF